MTVERARKKPVEIEFMRWDGTAAEATPIIDWILTSGATARYHCPIPGETTETCHSDYGHCIQIETLEGTMTANHFDVIIKGVQGEFYPCKPDIFAQTYDIITEGESA